MDSSRAGSIGWSASRLRISCFQLGICHPHDTAHRLYKSLPVAPLPCQNLATFSSEAVIASAPLIRLFNPPTLHQLPLLKPVEKRVERSDMEAQGSCRSCFDQLANVIPVAGLLLQQRENEQFCATLLPLTIGIVRGFHICWSHIYVTPIYDVKAREGLWLVFSVEGPTANSPNERHQTVPHRIS